MATGDTPSPRQSFAALRSKGARAYLLFSALAMMADSIEHVISYWVIFEKFHSPTLGGFAIIAHWVPFLLFSVSIGGLSDRFDPRRIIQIGMGLFIFVTIGWGVLLFVDGLQQWHAAVLLVIHGLAGVFWGPASQILVHDIAGTQRLQSAVRLLAMSRTLGILLGPAIGGAMMLLLGPITGLLLNALIYLPLTIWLWKAPYGPRFAKTPRPPARAIRGLADFASTLREIRAMPSLLAMIALAGAASFFVGNAYHAQMPAFAIALGQVDSSLTYTLLLSANAGGAVAAGLILEARNLLPAKTSTAYIMVILWCLALLVFSISTNIVVALVALFVAGVMYLGFMTMTQTLVQLHAPEAIRGRVIGLYSTSAFGLMAFSGVTIGIGGSFVGVHWSLGLSLVALLAAVILLPMLISMLARTARQPAE